LLSLVHASCHWGLILRNIRWNGLARALAIAGALSLTTPASAESLRVVMHSDVEQLHDAYARATDPAEQMALAEAIQVRISEYPTDVQLGQFNIPVAKRRNITGNLEAPVPVFWNVKKNGSGHLRGTAGRFSVL